MATQLEFVEVKYNPVLLASTYFDCFVRGEKLVSPNTIVVVMYLICKQQTKDHKFEVISPTCLRRRAVRIAATWKYELHFLRKCLPIRSNHEISMLSVLRVFAGRSRWFSGVLD